MKTIIEMAREAGWPEAWISETGVLKWSDLEHFAALVRADEREACAKFFDDNDTNMFWGSQAAQHIRARENT